jgi:hypothetical protein
MKTLMRIACAFVMSFITLHAHSQVVAVNDFDFTGRDYITLQDNVATNDVLPPGTATFTFLNESLYGEIEWTNPQTGAFIYNAPPETFFLFDHHTDSIYYQVCVGSACDTALIGIWLDHQNDKPVTPNDEFFVEAGSTRSGDVSLNDYEPDSISDPFGPYNFYYIVSYPDQGTLHDMNLDGVFNYTAPANFTGTVSFEYQVIDMCGAFSNGMVFLTIVANNENPLATQPAIQTINEDEPFTINLNPYATDPENDQLVFSAFNANATTLGIMQSNGTLNYTPTANFIGYDTLFYTVTDIVGQSDTAAVILHVVNANNDAPIALNQSYTGIEDSSLNTFISFEDEVDGDILTYTLLTPANHGETIISNQGLLIYTPDENYWGWDEFQFLACDQGNLCDTAIISINIEPINDAPQLTSDYNEITINGVLSGNLSLNATDMDSPENLITYAVIDSTQNGFFYLQPNGSYIYSPSEFFYGMDTLQYTACDNYGACTAGDLYITVTLINLPPEASPASFSIPEDALSSLDLNAATFDFGNGDLVYSIIDNPGVGDFSNLTNVGLAFQPQANQYGNYVISYRVCDTGGLCDTSEISLEVFPVNDAPIALSTNATTDEDMVISILPEFLDIDSDQLQVAFITEPLHGTLVNNEYNPNADYFGTDVIYFHVCDDLGLCDTGLIEINLSAVNDIPNAANDETFGYEDSWIDLNVSENDEDIDSPYLNYTLLEQDNSYNVNLTSDGVIQWLPPANFYGTIEINYEACDSDGVCDSAIAIIHVESVNDVPTANYPVIIIDEDSTSEFSSILYASDEENQTLSQSVASAWQIDADFNSETTSAQLTATNNYYGNAFIVISTCDSEGACSIDTAFIQILPVNDAPTGNSTTIATFQNTSLTGSWYNYVNDLDDTQLSFSATILHGSISMNSNGNFTYTPAENFIGQDTLWLQACDSSMSCIDIPLYVNVMQPNQPPILSNSTWSICQGDTVLIPLSNIASDELESSVELDYTLSSSISGSFIVDPINELIQIIPSLFYVGEMTIDLEVCDHASPVLCSFGTITLQITATTTPLITSVDVNHVTCNSLSNGSITIHEVSDTNGVLYNWTNGSTSEFVDNLAPGTYSVELIGLSACSNSTFAQFTIDEPEAITIDLNPQISTDPFSVTIESIVTGGTAPYSYVWNGPENFTSTAPNLESLNLTGDYTLQITDANNCSAGANLNITSILTSSINDFVVFPNPSNQNNITVEWPEFMSPGTKWKLIDSFGRLISEHFITSSIETINTSSLSPGLYHIVSNENGIILRSSVTILR